MIFAFVIFFQAIFGGVFTLPQNESSNTSPHLQNPPAFSTIPDHQNTSVQNNAEIGALKSDSPIGKNVTGNTTILKNEYVNDGVGNFHWAFETSDGIKAEQKGVPGMSRSGKAAHFKNGTDLIDGEEGGGEVSGSYSYTAQDGQNISVTYTAGVNGFRPKGAHIPTPPPNLIPSKKLSPDS